MLGATEGGVGRGWRGNGDGSEADEAWGDGIEAGRGVRWRGKAAGQRGDAGKAGEAWVRRMRGVMQRGRVDEGEVCGDGG